MSFISKASLFAQVYADFGAITTNFVTHLMLCEQKCGEVGQDAHVIKENAEGPAAPSDPCKEPQSKEPKWSTNFRNAIFFLTYKGPKS